MWIYPQLFTNNISYFFMTWVLAEGIEQVQYIVEQDGCWLKIYIYMLMTVFIKAIQKTVNIIIK